MERRIVKLFLLCVAAAATVGACRGDNPVTPSGEAPQNSAWVAPPRILTAAATPGGLRLSGVAQPGVRVVMRAVGGGAAFAAVADDKGRFDLRMTPPPGASLFQTEVQASDEPAYGQDRLLILDGGRGPLAVVRSGAFTRRLDRGPALAAVDSDAQSLILSGQARPDSALVVVVDGASQNVRADAGGYWSLRLAAAGARRIEVGDEAFVYPGPDADHGVTARRAGLGWLAEWALPDTRPQSVWLPDFD